MPDIDDHVPATQFEQVETLVAPEFVEYVPVIQLMHCVDCDNPVVEDHVPPTQFEQTEITFALV